MRLFKHKLLIKSKQDLKFSPSNSHMAAGHHTGSAERECCHGRRNALPGSAALEHWLAHAFLVSILQLLHLPASSASCVMALGFLILILPFLALPLLCFLRHQHFPFSPSVPDTAFQSTSQTCFDGNLNSRCP